MLETDSIYSGLVVDSAYGMQHFDMDSFDQIAHTVSDQIKPFVDGRFVSGASEDWSVFSVSTLAHDSKFINAAI